MLSSPRYNEDDEGQDTAEKQLSKFPVISADPRKPIWGFTVKENYSFVSKGLLHLIWDSDAKVWDTRDDAEL